MTATDQEILTATIFGNVYEDPLERRVRSEYREMPAMRLTIEQAMRLWRLDRTTCNHVLDSLVAAHFLERDITGRYARAHSGY